MGAVEDSLAGKTREERHELKARAFSQRLQDNLAERTFTRGQYAVTVNSFGVVIAGGVAVLDLRVTALRGGLPIPGFDGHLRFSNPPILVPAGTDVNGNPLYAEDLRSALRTIVGEEIERQVRKIAEKAKQ